MPWQKRFGLYSYGLYSSGLHSYGLHSYGPHSHGTYRVPWQKWCSLYSYGLHSYGLQGYGLLSYGLYSYGTCLWQKWFSTGSACQAADDDDGDLAKVNLQSQWGTTNSYINRSGVP